MKGYIVTPTDDPEGHIWATTNGSKPPFECDKALRVRSNHLMGSEALLGDAMSATWLRHPLLSDCPCNPIDFGMRINEVIASWHNTFSYVEEDAANQTQGLRGPQIGAVHATHAHWSVSDQIGTIVMPTGTGKTETMLSLLISLRCSRLLVVVPTNALRTQIVNKFLTLGLLKRLGVVATTARYPIVGTLRHKPKTVSEVDTFFEKCNVIVTTMQIAGQCSTEIQERMSHHCPYLFIDEAHHIGAQTWREFRQKFEGRRILQFTATPFREDDKPVGGKIIFNYPLSRAQKDGYFRRINFKPVVAFEQPKADQAIAELAVRQLHADNQQYNHIVMARVSTLERAKEVFAIYRQFQEFNPVQIHTGITSANEREQVRRKIINGESKIIVCVDMLGEGFDLPELKIAAFHDVRKSLSVTLQLAGRFTRSGQGLGEPTFIANIGDVRVRDELRKLYTQDPDWNVLLPQISESEIENQISLRDFIAGFSDFPADIPLLGLRPAMSTVVYRTQCSHWTPEQFRKGIQGTNSCDRIEFSINHHESTLVVVTAKKVPIDWAQVKDIFSWEWELIVAFWDEEQNLLFINSSSNSGYFNDLAGAIAGEVDLLAGPPVFRCLSGINRLKLQNVGLIEELGRLIRYTMRAGSDIEPALTEAQKQRARKANIFGVGYEGGSKTSIGCSYKGRIWSRKVTSLQGLTQWCRTVGKKIIDETIDPDEVLRGTLVSKVITERPHKMPIAIEWPEAMYLNPETMYEFMVDDTERIPLDSAELELVNPSETGDLCFRLCTDTMHVELVLELFEEDGVQNFRFRLVPSPRSVVIRSGGKFQSLLEFFYTSTPKIWFADGSSLQGNELTEPKRPCDPYPRDSIHTWNWVGVDITKESQGTAKKTDTVQYRVIHELKAKGYTVIFDDDSSGEAADIIAIQEHDRALDIEFYHCKFSKEPLPGARIDDLYAVCGQAQKSIYWKEEPTELFAHLLRREAKRINKGLPTRFEQGSTTDLLRITEKSRVCTVNLTICIVQPGLSVSQATRDQLELLGVTETYLKETYQLPLIVFGSF